MRQGIKIKNPGRKGGKIATLILILAALTIYLSATAIAEMYKWTDEKGEIHITDSPPPAATSPGEIKIYKDSQTDNLDVAPAPVINKKESRPALEMKKKADVVIYTTSWCPYCRKAREYFRSRGIDFTEYDIEKDKDAAIRKKQLDNRGGVPFAIINGRSISGFSASAYERALQE